QIHRFHGVQAAFFASAPAWGANGIINIGFSHKTGPLFLYFSLLLACNINAQPSKRLVHCNKIPTAAMTRLFSALQNLSKRFSIFTDFRAIAWPPEHANVELSLYCYWSCNESR